MTRQANRLSLRQAIRTGVLVQRWTATNHVRTPLFSCLGAVQGAMSSRTATI